jgi:hypothetical protein
MKILRKLALSLLILLAALPVFAGGVSREKAAETAAAFFRGDAKRASTSAGIRVTPAGEQSPAYAAFNREGGGFVVIALNDAVTPVLAYSDQGFFPSREEMPEAMAWWFSQLEEQIAMVPEGVAGSEEVRSQWANPRPKSLPATVQYETALWNQTEPFNNLCPTIGGQRCLTGCVAVVGSIIARYFQWPDAGVGTVPAGPGVPYQTGPDYPAHDLGHTYNWDNMPLDFRNGYDASQAEEVATLLYDMGTIARMDYGLEFSSANSSTLMAAMKQYMKYDKGAYEASREDYTAEGWSRLLKDILVDYGPTVYSGSNPTTGAGHAFILDGYDADGLFHFNWGWGAYGNCYCVVDNIIPEVPDHNYSAGQKVIVGLIPDRDGSSTGRDWLCFIQRNNYAGITLLSDSIEQNVRFTVDVGAIVPKVNAFQGKIFVSLYDKFGNKKADIDLYGGLDVEIPVNGYVSFPSLLCVIPQDIAPGDRIKVRYVGQHNEGIIDSGAGCTTEIIVMEDTGGGDEPDPTAGYSAAETAASTSLSYDKAGGILTLTFAHPANWEVKNSGGTAVSSGTATGGGNVAISLSGLASGTYTISIGSAEDPFSFTITK